MTNHSKQTKVLACAVMLFLTVFGETQLLAEVRSEKPSATPSVIGWWLFDFPPAGLSLLLKISSDGRGGYRATQDNLVVVGKRDQPESPFWCDGRNVRTEINHGADGIVQLRLNEKENTLEGTYRNGDLTIPMAYKHVQPADFPPEPLLDYSNNPTGAKDVRGYWAGWVTRDGARLLYGFQIGQAPDGTFRGSFDSFHAGRPKQRLSYATVTNNHVNIGNRDLGFSFDGTLSDDARSMKGKISDWADSGEVVFERLEKPATAPVLGERENVAAVPAAGTWDAVLDPQRSDVRVRVRIGEDPEGNLLALVSNPEENDAILVPSTSVTVQEKSLSVAWKGRGVTFQGELREDKLVGSWIEGKSKTPIVFTRVQTAE